MPLAIIGGSEHAEPPAVSVAVELAYVLDALVQVMPATTVTVTEAGGGVNCGWVPVAVAVIVTGPDADGVQLNDMEEPIGLDTLPMVCEPAVTTKLDRFAGFAMLIVTGTTVPWVTDEPLAGAVMLRVGLAATTVTVIEAGGGVKLG